MRHKFVSMVLVLGLLLTVGLPAAAANVNGTADTDNGFQVIAGGLDNPRGLTFGSDGTLFVAEAGRGGDSPCLTGPEGEVCFGNSGAVTQLAAGTQSRIVSDLVSLGAAPGGPMPQGSNAVGPHDVALAPNGSLLTLVGLGADPALRDPAGPLGDQGINFGQLVDVDTATNSWSNAVDIAAYEASANPDGGEIDSNPYGLATTPDGFAVADAGGNSLLMVPFSGTIQTLAVFPDRMVEFPPGSGNHIPMQAVPTAVSVGPDGAFYVGQLTGFPFPVGGAHVFRIDPAGGDPQIFASGFTNIIDLTFDARGNLFVLEFATHGLLSGDPTGRIVRISPNGRQTPIASEGLVAPGGIEVGPDGFLYVTNFSTSPSDGQVLRVQPHFQLIFPLISIN